MDVIRKILGLNGGAAAPEMDAATIDNNRNGKIPALSNYFKKPIWYDDESDDELFDNNKALISEIFSNPMEMHKMHDQRMQHMLKAMHQLTGSGDLFGENWRDDFMKPGDLSGFMDMRPLIDSDLNSEITAPMQSMMQRNAPNDIKMAKPFFAVPPEQTKQKRTDDEIILDKIHGIDDDDKPPKRIFSLQPLARMPQQNNAAEGFVHGPKTHRQSISFQVIRGPTGMVKTETVVGSDGNSKTTVERTENGETKTETFINGVGVNGGNYAVPKTLDGIALKELEQQSMVQPKMFQPEPKPWIVKYGRHITINKDGYAMPKNLW